MTAPSSTVSGVRRAALPQGLLLVALTGAAASLPWILPSEYAISLAGSVVMYATLAIAWNLIGGFAGYLSFGHAAFFGLGAYTTGMILAGTGASPFFTAPAGAAVAAVFALIAGYPCLRLRGPYFAVVTLILLLATRTLVHNVPWTGGSSGLWMPLPPWSPLISRTIFLEAMLGLLILTVLLAWAIQHGRAGLGLSAIREDEDVAGTIGVNAPRLKLGVFVLSAAIAGAVGGIYVFDRVFIVPESVFDLHLSIAIVLMALFGGRDSWIGPLIGAVVVRLLEEVLRIYVGAEAANIVFGLMLAVVIVFLPNGLLSLYRRRRSTPAAGAG